MLRGDLVSCHLQRQGGWADEGDAVLGRMGGELHLRLRSGTEVTFSCVKVDPGEVFAQALTERLGRS